MFVICINKLDLKKMKKNEMTVANLIIRNNIRYARKLVLPKISQSVSITK